MGFLAGCKFGCHWRRYCLLELGGDDPWQHFCVSYYSNVASFPIPYNKSLWRVRVQCTKAYEALSVKVKLLQLKSRVEEGVLDSEERSQDTITRIS